MRRPDRVAHLKLCGFNYCGTINPDDIKPREAAIYKAKALEQATGNPHHVVYLPQGVSMDGLRGYGMYSKEL